ncbi:MAG: hypothetical protein M3511_14875, partial [Deinococcota bacterium]|nr:hypothetical protein [Deinococcota bacterium]
MTQLTAVQARVLSCLEQHWQHVGGQPSLHDVAASLGIGYITLRQHLKALEAKGYLRYKTQGSGKAPILQLLKEARGVPLLGDIPAGPLNEALAQPLGYLQLAGVTDGYFGLYVRGDSMAEFLHDGDVVLLKHDQPQRSGEICALRLDHSDATLKYLDWKGARPRKVQLRPHNPSYPTVTVNAKDVLIDGVYKGSFRGEPVSLLFK